MTKEKLEKYKNQLLKEKEQMEAKITEEETPPDFGHDIDRFEEKTDEADAFTNQLGVASDSKTRLDDIDMALEKIRTGTYGVCEKCGGEIEEEILDIDPESRLCKNCKEQAK